MNFGNVKALGIPEGKVKQIARKSDGLLLWKGGYTNMVPLSIDTDGSVYNGGLGYKDGYRVRSGGAEGAESAAACTGFIPFKQGDVLRIYPAFTGQNIVNAINFVDASFTNLGQNCANGSGYGICNTNNTQWDAAVQNVVDGITVIDISDIPNAGDVAYVRVTNHIGTASSGAVSLITTGADMIVTINEEIE